MHERTTRANALASLKFLWCSEEHGTVTGDGNESLFVIILFGHAPSLKIIFSVRLIIFGVCFDTGSGRSSLRAAYPKCAMSIQGGCEVSSFGELLSDPSSFVERAAGTVPAFGSSV